MPRRAPSICTYPGCNVLVRGESRCSDHRTIRHKEIDAHRKNASQRGYDWRWQKARKVYLKRNPLCVKCSDGGITNVATVVDHIIDHKGDHGLFWDEGNWQSLCKTHHDQKTASTHLHGGGGSK